MATSSTEPMSSSVMNPMVTPEEFKTFHTIDRTLYTRLVVSLNRDPAESMQVMALWLWLEREARDHGLVHKMLSLPDALIHSLAKEAVLCLNCVEYDRFPFCPETNINDEVPLTRQLTRASLTLKFFHDNRLGILRALTRIMNEVCSRAFDDILRHVSEKRATGLEGSSTSNVDQNGLDDQMNPLTRYGPVINPLLYYNSSAGMYGHGHGQMGIDKPQFTEPNMNNINGGQNPGILPVVLNPYDHLAVQRQILSAENLAAVLNRIKISNGDLLQEEKDALPADSRTIFLTFSKGYPISEDEVREFFSKKHGDCIEAIFMQEVSGEEQPLYARLVVRSPVIIHNFLEGQSKAKFTINGKHVWARKYVRKSPKLSSSPPKSPSSPQPTSPVEQERQTLN